MFFEFSEYSYVIKPGATDMRCGWQTLASIVSSCMELDPLSKTMFLFCNGSRTIVRILVWDDNGFWVCSKRLHSRSFCWPDTEEQSMNISLDDIRRLLTGQDVFRRLDPIEGKIWA